MENKSLISSSSGHSNHPNKQPTNNNTFRNIKYIINPIHIDYIQLRTRLALL